ncbi:MAG TPA: hypothetical protein VEV15_10420, partial [Flavisolibacter sp.]|nr:hypothetical protein [Flavisolibacter sp.]
MRIVFVFVFVFLISAQTLSAQVIGGLYSGTLVNDSTQKEQRYELALSEYRGKITGYSYTTFVRNDSLFYGVKRVKATRKNNQLVVEDDKMIANNFPESAAKGVHQTNFIQLTNEDTLRSANGSWQTNRTKIYYAIGGNVALQLNNDSSHSALIAHLKELNIISQPRYEAAVTQMEEKVKDKVETTQSKTETAIAKNGDKKNKETRPDKNVEKERTKITPDAAKTTSVSIPYTERKRNVMSAIEVSSDSLVLSFYDNGVIDGDSISVYVNGENIITSARLTATATKRTIVLPQVETIEIILVAENLGTIPPNTGLLVVKNGDKSYQLNFTADLQTNAALIIKRK